MDDVALSGHYLGLWLVGWWLASCSASSHNKGNDPMCVPTLSRRGLLSRCALLEMDIGGKDLKSGTLSTRFPNAT